MSDSISTLDLDTLEHPTQRSVQNYSLVETLSPMMTVPTRLVHEHDTFLIDFFRSLDLGMDLKSSRLEFAFQLKDLYHGVFEYGQCFDGNSIATEHVHCLLQEGAAYLLDCTPDVS